MVDRHAKLYSVFVAMDADGSGYVGTIATCCC